MIPEGSVEKVVAILKELGGVSFNALWSLLQWEGIQKEDSAYLVKVLKRFKVIEEKNGILKYVGRD